MRNIKYILFILSSFLLFNCGGENFFDSIVEVEVPAHESNLAMTAHLSNLEVLFSLVHVTRTIGILDNQDAEPIKDAKVELYSDGQLFQAYEYRELFKETNQNGDTIIRDVYIRREPEPLMIGKTYELRVSSPTYGEIMATQSLLPPTPINSGTYEENGISGIFEDIDTNGNEDDRAEEIAIKFQDLAGEKNYYAVQTIGIYENSNEEYVEPFYLTPVDPSTEEGLNSLILSDAAFDGKEYELKMAAFGETEGLKRIEVILYSITEDRYLYELSLINYEENDGNPFAEPVIIHENVTNGNGIFTLSSGSIFSIEI